MKTIKPLVLAVLVTFQLSSALAVTSSDPVVDQINITSDAVQTALEEFKTGRMTTPSSEDAAVKLKKFNEDASRGLVKFEQDVRFRVLQSFSILVGQYNSILKNRSLGDSQQSILDSLYKQIQTVAIDKSFVYKESVLELYSILPNLPVEIDFKQIGSPYNEGGTAMYGDYEDKQVHSLCMNSVVDCDSYLIYEYSGSVYSSQSGTKEIRLKSRTEYLAKDVVTFLTDNGFSNLAQARTMLLDGCYSSSCYFTMQTQYTIWKSMISSTLARDINITLDDGRDIKITTDVSRNGKSLMVIDNYLTKIPTEGLINNLPFEASLERVNILKAVDQELASRPSCSKIKKLKDRLCHETQEGCLKESEVELFKDRFNSKISCLAK